MGSISLPDSSRRTIALNIQVNHPSPEVILSRIWTSWTVRTAKSISAGGFAMSATQLSPVTATTAHRVVIRSARPAFVLFQRGPRGCTVCLRHPEVLTSLCGMVRLSQATTGVCLPRRPRRSPTLWNLLRPGPPESKFQRLSTRLSAIQLPLQCSSRLPACPPHLIKTGLGLQRSE